MAENHPLKSLRRWEQDGLPVDLFLGAMVRRSTMPWHVVRVATLHGTDSHACGAGGDPQTIAQVLTDLEADPANDNVISICSECLPKEATDCDPDVQCLEEVADILLHCRAADNHVLDVPRTFAAVDADVAAGTLTTSVARVLVQLRRSLDLADSAQHTPLLHPDRQDRFGVLGDWWPRQFQAWCTQLERTLGAARAVALSSITDPGAGTGAGWDGPRQLVTLAHRPPVQEVDLIAQLGALWETPDGSTAQLVACADLVGYVRNPAVLPGFSVPAGWAVTDPNWVSLGTIKDPAAALDLLVAYAQVAPSAAEGAPSPDVISALRTALGYTA